MSVSSGKNQGAMPISPPGHHQPEFRVPLFAPNVSQACITAVGQQAPREASPALGPS